MQFIKQPTSLSIKNIDDIIQTKNTSYRKHGNLLPNNIRCIICGPSNCGKTNVIISLIENLNGLRFENVYIYSRSLYQPKYVYLKQLLSQIKGIGFYSFSSNEVVIPPEQVKPNSVFIFDDVQCDKQNNIQSYFCMGRHKDVDCFYLSQSYTHIPKHLIRENANLIVLFKQDEMNLRHIYNDHSISIDMSFNQFKEICNQCWNTKHNFVVIDKESDLNKGKYRKGFDQYIHIKQKIFI